MVIPPNLPGSIEGLLTLLFLRLAGLIGDDILLVVYCRDSSMVGSVVAALDGGDEKEGTAGLRGGFFVAALSRNMQ